MKRIFYLGWLALFVACNDASSVHLSRSGEAKIHVTTYRDELELMVSHDPLVVNEHSEIIFSLSEIKPYMRPLTEAAVTVSLVTNDKGIRNQAKTSVTGFYSVGLKPLYPGVSRLIFDVKKNGKTHRFFLDGLTVFHSREEANASSKPVQPANVIYLSKEKIWNSSITTESVSRQPLKRVIKASGQFVAAPGQEIAIVSRVPGIVQFNQANLASGARVLQGRSLFSVRGGDINAEGNIDMDIRQASLAFRLAEDEYNRAKQLVEERLITRDKFMKAEYEYHNSQARLNHLRQNYNGSGKSIPTPVTGFIKELLVQQGQYVTAGQPLAVISKNQKVLLRVNVPVSEAHRRWQHANFVLQQGSEVYNTRNYNGKPIAMATYIRDHNPILPLFFEIDHQPMWIPGALAEVYLETGRADSVLAVPRAALLEEQGLYYVIIQTGGETFEKREVTIGGTDGERVEVTNGLQEGQRLVVKGVYQIRIAASVNSVNTHDHAH